MDKHTPHSQLPWKVEWNDGALHMRSADGESLMCNEQYYPWVPRERKDWDFIVRAVNNHERLLEALNGLVGLVQLVTARSDMPENIKAAIAANHRLLTANEAIRLAEAEAL